MKSVICPYCNAPSYTSSPEIMARCASCGKPFAEVVSPDGKILIIIDSDYPDADAFARDLTARWQAAGESGRAAIVDRRRDRNDFGGDDRRRYSAE